MNEVRLGIDVACRADHRASLADERGEFIWSSWKFRTTTADLERLWAKIPDGASVTVILGFVPKIDQSGLVAGHKGITKAGDAGLRRALYMAADHARHIDPTLAQRYYRLVMVEGKHHNSALCSVSTVLITRIAACWRKRELYQLRDENGEAITEAEGKAACIDRFKIDPKVRAARRRNTPAKALKNRVAGRGRKESAQKVAPATDPPGKETTENVA